MRNTCILAALLALASCTIQAPTEPELSGPKAETAQAIIPGVLNVEFSEEMTALLEEGLQTGCLETKSPGLNSAFSSLGVTSVERIFPDAGEWEPRHREAGLHRWYRVRFSPEIAVTKASNDFYGIPGVISAEPKRRIKYQAFFNDPYADKQWSLYNPGTPASTHKAGIDINVYPVWERFTAGSNDVIVAVMDGGVQLDHPDLKAITLPAGPDGSKCFVDGYSGYSIPADDHGTHCAGIIAAVNDNGVGISGIAGGRKGEPGVRIMSCAIMMDNPDPDAEHNTLGGDDAGAFVWAADHGAVISSNSWGFVYESETEASRGDRNPGFKTLRTAIDYFIKNAGCDKNGNQRADSPMKGGVVIFAAGNESWQHAWPAEYDNVVAVGAVSAKGGRAYYSNFGDWVDICAPGGDAKEGPTILSCVDQSKYANMQGTSMACPHVSGVAALIASYFGGPGFTNEMLVDRLLGGANKDKAPYLSRIGPLVDAMGSFSYGGTTAPEPTKVQECSARSNFISVSMKVTADPDEVKAYGCRVIVSPDRSVFDNLDPSVIPEGVAFSDVEAGRLEIGSDLSLTMEDFEFEKDYFVAVAAYDYARNYSALSEIAQVKTGPNSAPVIDLPAGLDMSFKAFEKRTFEIPISEPDGHEFKISVETASDFVEWDFMDGKLRCTVDALKADYGPISIAITATDKYGLGTTRTLTGEVQPNHGPKAASKIDNILFKALGEYQEHGFASLFIDEDGETPEYSVSTSPAGVVHLYPDEGTLRIIALGYGLAEAKVKATDARGASDSLMFRVFVKEPNRSVDIYPNPVKTKLNIRPAAEGTFEITIINKIGAVVYSSKSESSPFFPIAIDVTGFDPGAYSVNIKGAGIDGTYTIVKI